MLRGFEKLLYNAILDQKAKFVDIAMNELKENFISCNNSKKKEHIKKELTKLMNIRPKINNNLPIDHCTEAIINGDNILNVKIDNKTSKFYFDMDNSYLN